MRLHLITLLIILACVQVAAKGYAQRISLKVTDAPLKTILKSIEQQSGGYLFWYKDNLLSDSKKVTLDLKDASLKEALEQVFKDQPISYQIVDLTITLIPKEKKIIESLQQYFAAIQVSGMVTNEKGEPMAGVNVTIKGASTGTITNDKGYYRLTTESNNTLVFNFLGYSTIEIPIKGNTVINQSLTPKSRVIEEMIVKGYYTTTKTLNTGNVSTVTGEDIRKQPVGDPLMALEGRVAGLYVNQTSGVPGSTLNVRLRGQNSIANGNNPFFIIDGVPYPSNSLSVNSSAAINVSPFSSLNPSDIESIEVLKDADATAIYGSRGANGVIIITTRRGTMGKTKLDFNIYSGFGATNSNLKMMNTEQYVQMRKEAFKNDNIAPGITDYDVNGTWDQSAYTDWQKKIIGGTANMTDAQISISGGSDLTQFLIGGGYRRESTVFPGDFSDKKASLKININHQSENKRFNLKSNFSYINDINKLPTSDLSSAVFLAPNAPSIYKENGDLNWQNSTWVNPFGIIRQFSSIQTDNYIIGSELSYRIFENLNVKANISYNNLRLNDNRIIPFSSLDPASPSPANQRTNATGLNSVKSWIVEPQLSYSTSINRHQFDILVGSTLQDTKQNSLRINASGFANDAQIESIGFATAVTSSNTATFYKYNALFGRFGYNYANKYVVNLTARRDGSSRFGPGKQFGNFGAIGLAWIFSREDFVRRSLKFLSSGKIRGSIGKTGNDQLSDYQYLDTYTPNGYTYLGVTGINPTQLTNPEFGWETINKTEVGIELGFFKDRVQFNASYFRNRTGNQLVGYNLPSISGFTTVQANLPAIIQNKGIELELNTINIQKNKFTWRTAYNISIPNNKLVSYPNIEGSSYATTYVVGQPLFVKFLYKYTGVDANTGLYTYEDLNHDNAITSAADRLPYFIGQKYFGGINNSITYKNFSLDIFMQFVKQNGYSMFTYYSPGQLLYNQPEEAFDRWKSVGDASPRQKYTTRFSGPVNTAANNFENSTGRVNDASFIRLKNISFSWNPKFSLARKLNISNLRIYLQAQNLLTFTSFEGPDPETNFTGRGFRLPTLKYVTGGFQISL